MFQDALIGYQSILNQDIGNDILYYNIANCYYKLNKLGYARLYYEKVNMCNPSDKDVAHNIQIVKNKLIDDIVPLPEFFIVGIIKRMNSMFSASQWGYIAVFFLYLILLFFILFLFSASVDFKVNSLRGVILLVPIFLIVLFFLFYSNRAKPLEAILIEDNTYVKTAPSESSSDYFIIHEGIKFQLIDELDGWSRILLSDGKDGWLQNKTFQKIQ
tara:strand:+ start:320 stop:964 length:645 start_codon:yes stop_codon:yes gene_type:complete